jgi:hypothetical protein
MHKPLLAAAIALKIDMAADSCKHAWGVLDWAAGGAATQKEGKGYVGGHDLGKSVAVAKQPIP